MFLLLVGLFSPTNSDFILDIFTYHYSFYQGNNFPTQVSGVQCSWNGQLWFGKWVNSTAVQCYTPSLSGPQQIMVTQNTQEFSLYLPPPVEKNIDFFFFFFCSWPRTDNKQKKIKQLVLFVQVKKFFFYLRVMLFLDVPVPTPSPPGPLGFVIPGWVWVIVFFGGNRNFFFFFCLEFYHEF
jgi:hypothetical protein